MAEPTMSWEDLLQNGRDRGLLVKTMYAVHTTPVNGLGPVMAVIDEHVAWQVKLEQEGIMFAAGPFSNIEETEWDGEGFFIYRASSREEAISIAERDPMHSSGARSFTVRTWMVNEGSYRVNINYSTGRAEVI